MPNPSSQDIEIYNRTQRPNFSESLVYYIDNELKQIEKAIRNIKDAVKSAEDRLTAGGL
tara:strand:- start:271 stop:447 length:177 start_codon:yes stop_codon:yes gene_type:complete